MCCSGGNDCWSENTIIPLLFVEWSTGVCRNVVSSYVSYRLAGETVGSGGSESAGAEERANLEQIEQSHKAVLKLYGRTVGVLRDKRERELLTEALCDIGDLHVSEYNCRARLD